MVAPNQARNSKEVLRNSVLKSMVQSRDLTLNTWKNTDTPKTKLDKYVLKL